MRINNNLMAMNAQRNLAINAGNQAKALEKLSSGYRINRAGDDAAGLAISEKMRGQIRGLQMASKNSQDGISLIQTAEGALSETHSILQRMRELSVQAANDTNVTKDRSAIKTELDQLALEVSRIANQTEFNTQKLMASGATFSGVFQVGANNSQTISLSITSMTAGALGVSAADLVVSNATDAGNTVSAIQTAIETVSQERAKLGAMQNRLEHTIANLDTAAENLQAAESRIRDVDMAKEMMNYSKQNILNQAATAMLAQANQAPQGVLQLLR
ncbi:MAG TPA: flagellin [Bacillota bacterium]|nr:flagellin [Bacillota bacterium]